MNRTIVTSRTCNLIDMINVMKRQENSAYLTKNGLYDQQQTTKKDIKIDGECRRLMVIWFKQLAEFIDMNHHTVAIAVNTLDRFIEKERHILSSDNASHEYQLAAIASLYTIVKTQELLALDPITMSKLCKGSISTKDIEKMEYTILTKLQWRMNAPTSMAFAEIYLKILFPSLEEEEDTCYSCGEKEEEKKEDQQTTSTPPSTYYSIYKKLIQCQLEYAMEDSRFLGMSASEVAFTATYNAIISINNDDDRLLSSLLNGLKNSIAAKFLPSTLKDDLMDHMQRTESDTISSACYKKKSQTRTATTKQEEEEEEQQFGWVSSGKSYYLSPRSISPRSITMSRE